MASPIKRTYSEQFRCPAIIVDRQMDAGAVIAEARAVGALCRSDGEERFVIDNHTDRYSIGPEAYSEEALRYFLEPAARQVH